MPVTGCEGMELEISHLYANAEARLHRKGFEVAHPLLSRAIIKHYGQYTHTLIAERKTLCQRVDAVPRPTAPC